jgi:hypothetical protein
VREIATLDLKEQIQKQDIEWKESCGGPIESIVVEEFGIPEELLENEVKCFLAEKFKLRAKLNYGPSALLRIEDSFRILQ